MIDQPKKIYQLKNRWMMHGWWPLRYWSAAFLNEQRLNAKLNLITAPLRKPWVTPLQAMTDNAIRLWIVLMFQAWLEEQQRA